MDVALTPRQQVAFLVVLVLIFKLRTDWLANQSRVAQFEEEDEELFKEW